MKAFYALVHREFIEHKGAFLIGPLLLLALIFGTAILAFSVGRVDVRFSGAMLTVVPLRIYEFGFLGLGMGWALYLTATLFFYCADGFAADKRNNAMLFWKSMPVSDFKVLLSKLVAAVTILPLTVFAMALLSGVLLYAIAFVAMQINGTASAAILGDVIGVYGQVAVALFGLLLSGLLWYLPFMAMVGAIATVVGRWAIPITLLLPTIVSTLEWVTMGGVHPFATHVWRYIEYRAATPSTTYGDAWFAAIEHGDGANQLTAHFDGVAFAGDLLVNLDWLQIAIGLVFALVAIYAASEYRRRVNDN